MGECRPDGILSTFWELIAHMVGVFRFFYEAGFFRLAFVLYTVLQFQAFTPSSFVVR